MDTTTYVDCGSGVAGDMLLGALVDLGLSGNELNRMLKRVIGLDNWQVRLKRTERQGWPAWSLIVEGDRHFGSGERMMNVVRRSGLPSPVKSNALKILSRLVEAEKQAHGGKSHGDFDPNGLGLLDTLVDVIGNAWGFWKLGFEKVTASHVNTGRIAPASARLLKQFNIPAYSAESKHELATPTGLAILSVLAQSFGPMPSGQMENAGYGAGLKDIAGKPNVLAIYRARGSAAGEGLPLESVLLLETIIDDMDPRLYPHVTDLLMKAGALDVWWISAGMKKGRPGTAYSVLCRPEDEKKLVNLIFTETTTLGIRRLPLERWTLARHSQGIRKFATLSAGLFKSQAEYELARQKAFSLSIPLKKLLK